MKRVLEMMVVTAMLCAPVQAKSVPRLAPPPIALGLDGYCPVSLWKAQVWVRGDFRWGSVYEGCKYYFAGPGEKLAFDNAPQLFAPAASGLDVVLLIDNRQRVPGHREHGVWFNGDGRVYLFASEESLSRFCALADYYVANLGQDRVATIACPKTVSPPPSSGTKTRAGAPYLVEWRGILSVSDQCGVVGYHNASSDSSATG